MQVHDPHYKVSEVFDRCQEQADVSSPGFCLTKPTLVKKVARKPEIEMNDTGSKFFTNKTNPSLNDQRTIDIQKSSVKILKQLMQHNRANKNDKNQRSI